ncbi:MAG: hypothetical protein K0S65_6087 [Labilithrix sp.]|nr:hypothetical protein [Labilithrix sp.]
MCSSIQRRLRPGLGLLGAVSQTRRRGRGEARRWAPWFVAVGAMLAALTSAPRARAETKFAFSWHAEPGAASCLTEEKVRKAVEKKLGRSVFSSLDEADIVIDGEELVGRHPYRARVRQHARKGRELGARELTAETCDALERMTVVFIALVLERGGAAERLRSEAPPASPAPLPAHEPDPPPEPTAPLAPTDDDASAAVNAPTPAKRRSSGTRRAPTHRVELHAGVAVGAAVGMLPSPSASVRLMTRLTVQGSRLSADWSIGLSVPQTVTRGAVCATFAAVDQQARGCWAWFDGTSSRLDTCAGAIFGALIPTGANLDELNGSAVSLLGPTASVGLRLSESPATLHIELGAAALAVRHTISYLARNGEERTLYAMPPLMAMATLAGTFRAF